MKEISLPAFEARDDLSTVRYHLKEIVSSQERVADLAQKVDTFLEADRDSAATNLSYLEVEIFDHLAYHIRELRMPFKAFLEELYGSAE